LIRQAINLEETAVGLNKRRLIQSAVVKELVRVCKTKLLELNENNINLK
jgi:hypothetical protein